MVPNIDKLYTIGKNLLPRVWIRDRYLKIRICLTQINWQSLSFLHKKMFDELGTFFSNVGYHCDEEVEKNLLEPRNGGESGQMTAEERRPAAALPRPAIKANDDAPHFT